MSHRRLWLLGALVAAGCAIESGLGGGDDGDVVGNPPPLDNPVQTDRVTQVVPPQADILWMVDNSCSMSCVVGCHDGTIVENVTENFPVFMEHFEGSGVDYHIGVVTSDMDDNQHQGKLQAARGELWVDEGTDDPIGTFKLMAEQGTSGVGTEEGLGGIWASMEQHGSGHNDGFFRDNAVLHTIVLSNEPDATDPSIVTASEFVDWYSDLRSNVSQRTFSSIVCVETNSDACPNGTRGDDYIMATYEIGGIVWPIDKEEGWEELLDALGAQAAGQQTEYFLTQVPVADTIEVTVYEPGGAVIEFEEYTDATPDGGWAYNQPRNSVTFVNEYKPPELAEVAITYVVAAAVVAEE